MKYPKNIPLILIYHQWHCAPTYLLKEILFYCYWFGSSHYSDMRKIYLAHMYHLYYHNEGCKLPLFAYVFLGDLVIVVGLYLGSFTHFRTVFGQYLDKK